ncbi:membrane protein, putative [Minicystis rosea]|nr:membrane protein, putative [Minicystis rosea]
MIRRALAPMGLLLALATLAGPAAAHEFRPAILDIRDLGAGRYELFWSAPSAGGDPEAILTETALSFPEGCRREPGGGDRFTLDCGPTGLAGRAITIRGLTHGDALVRFEGPGGPVSAVLREGDASFTVPGPEGVKASFVARARGYFSAGVAHILQGIDHLLFVLGLLLLVRGKAALVRTITAFTIAHSITLALAVTAAVRLPPAPVEAAIGLSLVLLAAELARPRPDEPTLARREPSWMAFAFGLLHGFGFAGGLAELRVPQTDLPLALAGFNLGVEAGQLAFVAAALAVAALLRRAFGRGLEARFARVPAYLIGSLGALFVYERVAAFWRS